MLNGETLIVPDLAAPIRASSVEPFPTLWEAATMAMSSPEPLVPGFVSGALTQFVGPPKAAKSIGACELIRAALTDTAFFDVPLNWRIERVLLLTTDPGAEREYADRLVSGGVPVESLDNLLTARAPRGATRQELDEIKAKLEMVGVGPGTLVILDHYGGLVEEQVSDPSKTGPATTFLIELTDLGCVVVFLHHSSEKIGDHGQTKYGMGSTYIKAAVRQWTTFRTKKETFIVRGSSQSGEQAEAVRRWVTPGIPNTSLDHAAVDGTGAQGGSRPRLSGALAEACFWVVENHAEKSNAEIGQLVAAEHPGISKGVDKARSISKGLSEKKLLGKYLHRVDGRLTWRPEYAEEAKRGGYVQPSAA
ncbi:AAA family ATPase [Jiangella gansuensis]|uniref:AAA family ATPase n=1 Tax=Jiangella gansuensis TaxID=281473 RepID=UPI0004BA2899|nr:AAA family ATPase [Jiangella gansuensis]